RYHSLVTVHVPPELEVTAWTGGGSEWKGQGLVMAVAHRTLPMWGVQFHPESIETRGGQKILANFVRLAGAYNARREPDVPDMTEPPVLEAFRRVGGAAQLQLHARPLETEMSSLDLFRA